MIQIDSFKRHLQSMQNIRPRLKIQTPWKPSFSLSKRMNKYHRSKYLCYPLVTQNSIDRENQSLLKRMIHIESEPMVNTVNIIPTTIPSNKGTHAQIKNR